MQKIHKLTILGGGSTYTPELLSGFIEHQADLAIDHIALYDIDDERLAVVGGLVQRMFHRAELSTSVTLIHELPDAVEGANFVISQIRVGGSAARIIDERIPLSHNVLGQETVGAGGIFKALRTIPVTLEFAHHVARLAPNAWFLNFTNPSGIITEALIKHSGLTQVIGLCNVPVNSEQAVASMLNVRPEQVWFDWLGLNHLSWIRKLTVAGCDRLPEVMERLSQNPPTEAYEKFPFDGLLLARLNLLPTYYLRYYYETPKILVEIQTIGKTRGEFVAEIEKSLLEKYRNTHLEVKPPELSQRGGSRYSEAAIRLMLSLISDRRDVQILIVCNNGAITGLPDDVAVEVPAVVGAHGVTPLTRGAPPDQVKSLLESVKSSDILTIEAGVSGSRQKIVQALWANPLVPSFEMAETLTEELLYAHRDYLPQFL